MVKIAERAAIPEEIVEEAQLMEDTVAGHLKLGLGSLLLNYPAPSTTDAFVFTDVTEALRAKTVQLVDPAKLERILRRMSAPQNSHHDSKRVCSEPTTRERLARYIRCHNTHVENQEHESCRQEPAQGCPADRTTRIHRHT